MTEAPGGQKTEHASDGGYDVTVVVPTLGVRPEIDRAVDSVTGQRGVRALALVVVNGDRSDPARLAALAARPGVRVMRSAERGVSASRLAGRRAVETEFFAFLDDDDEFLPDGIAASVARLRADPAIDVVVTNGLRETASGRTKCFDRFGEMTDDPASDLLRENWLSSSGGVYRTSAVGAEVFADLPDHFEMTLIALRLALGHRIARFDEATFLIHEGTADRASQSVQYFLNELDIIARMERLATAPSLLRALRKKRAGALHNCSTVCRAHGMFAAAWSYHLRSLLTGEGWCYILSTRHLLAFRR